MCESLDEPLYFVIFVNRHIFSGFILTNKMNKVKSGKHYSTSILAFQTWIIAKDNSACENTDERIQWSPKACILNHLAFWNIGNEMVTCLIFFLIRKIMISL